eukprot:m.2898 g.2898  ORF g.2898 m.2898 type:complete len:84 (+) comp1827_c0_seq2:346-597(+)
MGAHGANELAQLRSLEGTSLYLNGLETTVVLVPKAMEQWTTAIEPWAGDNGCLYGCPVSCSRNDSPDMPLDTNSASVSTSRMH